PSAASIDLPITLDTTAAASSVAFPSPVEKSTTSSSSPPVKEPAPDAAASLKRAVEQPPPKRSWFGSLSRSRGVKLASQPPAGTDTADSSLPTNSELPADTHQSSQLAASSPVSSAIPNDVEPDTARPVTAVEVTAEPARPSAPRAPSSDATIRRSAPQPIPPAPIMMRTSTLSSVDSQVPSLPNSPMAAGYDELAVASSGLRDNQRRLAEMPVTSSSGLNPSSSRFMLSLPLLGRPKVPLEQVVKLDQTVRQVAVKGKDAVNPDATSREALAGADQSQPLKESQSSDGAQASPTPDLQQSVPSGESRVADATPDDRKTEHARETQRTASWWDYVGWGTGPSQEDTKTSSQGDTRAKDAVGASQPSQMPQDSQAAPASEDAPAQQHATEKSVSQDTNPTSGGQQDSPVVNEPRAPVRAQVDGAQPAPVASNKALSVHSTAGSAYWYLPWAWYYGSGDSDDGKGDSNAAGDKAALGDKTAQDKVAANGEQARASLTDDERAKEAELTAAERVKEAALARDRGQEGKVVAPPAEQRAHTDSAKDDMPAVVQDQPVQRAASAPSRSETPSIAAVLANPVATIVTSRSGWASFFTSNRTLTRRIEDVTRDENGMEVMEIGDEEDEAAQARNEDRTQADNKDAKDGKEATEGKDSKPAKDPSRPGSATPSVHHLAVKTDRARADSVASAKSDGTTSVKSKAPTLVISDDVKAKAKEVMKAKEDSRKGRDGKVKDIKVKDDPRKDDKDRA
ncbi:hypothetical protein HDZ31DRAFT_78087, partial [Schizophyllum fasciatum]